MNSSGDFYAFGFSLVILAVSTHGREKKTSYNNQSEDALQSRGPYIWDLMPNDLRRS